MQSTEMQPSRKQLTKNKTHNTTISKDGANRRCNKSNKSANPPGKKINQVDATSVTDSTEGAALSRDLDSTEAADSTDAAASKCCGTDAH